LPKLYAARYLIFVEKLTHRKEAPVAGLIGNPDAKRTSDKAKLLMS
jgi:hypothetical protein